MKKKEFKPLKDMTLRDNFMFCAVMADPSICKEFLELVLQIPIEQVEVNTERSLIYHPEYHGVRLDVLAKETTGSFRHFDVEMQSSPTPIGLRSRYYCSQMDMDLLRTGKSYKTLPDSYVIFICDYDPIGKGAQKYVFQTLCKDIPDYDIRDGRHLILLNASAEAVQEMHSELAQVLQYIHADLKDTNQDFHSPFVKRLQTAVNNTKSSRQMEVRYMSLQLLIEDIREESFAEGRAEGRIENLRNSIQALCESLQISQEEAMKLLKLSEEDRFLLQKQ